MAKMMIEKISYCDYKSIIIHKRVEKMDVIAVDLITQRSQVIQLVIEEMLMLEIKPVSTY